MTTECLTAENITNQISDAFPFTVEKFPLSGPDNMRTPHYGLFRSDNQKCVGNSVSKGYEPHTVDDVCALAEAAAAAFNGASNIRAYWNEGHYVTISPSAAQQKAAFEVRYPDSGAHQIRKDSDIYFPRLIIRAGYDGKSFSASLGIYRLICKNLATIPVNGEVISTNIRHTKSLRPRMDTLIQDMTRVVSRFNEVEEQIDRAAQKEINMKDFIREVYPIKDDASKRERTNFENRVQGIMTRMYVERNKLGFPSLDPMRANAWEAFNAVQGYVQHDARRNKNPSDFDRALLALNDKAVAKAAELAFA